MPADYNVFSASMFPVPAEIRAKSARISYIFRCVGRGLGLAAQIDDSTPVLRFPHARTSRNERVLEASAA